jgi:hypothetical protein
MTTLGELRATLREILPDATFWPDASVNAWIQEAIWDFSGYFPLELSGMLNLAANVRIYLLSDIYYSGTPSYGDAMYASDVVGVVQVEYPYGQDPPRFLTRKQETAGIVGEAVFDVRGNPPKELVLGEKPAASEQARVVYTCGHDIPVDDDDVITVPGNRQEAIIEFVRWQAIREAEMNETMDPDTKNLVLSMVGLNSGRSERIYRAKIRDYQGQEAAGGYVAGWRMDDKDRVY